MPLKKTSEYNKQSFVYESEDGDDVNVTIVLMDDRKYIELQRGQDEESKQVWDLEMFLDISDAARLATQAPSTKTKRHNLVEPGIIDHRHSTPESIQNTVNQSMEQEESNMPPIVSLMQPNEQLQKDIEDRKTKGRVLSDSSKKITTKR